MSQSAVDLPDPLNQRGGTTNADDLLAQLAGEEVDRLLADSENGADALAPTNTDHAPKSAADAALDDLYNQLNVPVEPEPPPPPKADPTQAALDDLFGQLQSAEIPIGKPPAAPAEPSPAVEMVKQSTPAAVEAPAPEVEAHARAIEMLEPPSAAAELAAEMDADARANAAAMQRMDEPAEAVAAEAVAEEATSSAEAVEPESAVTIDEAEVEQAQEDAIASGEVEVRAPLLVRVLEWINSPFGDLSDAVRSALGKVALVTMFNAVAVLVYVLVFRKH